MVRLADQHGVSYAMIECVGEIHADFYIRAYFMIIAGPISVYCHEFNPPRSWRRGDEYALESKLADHR